MRGEVHSVIGLGFGDEGKGVVVDWLCSKYDPDDTYVIRHSGGHQVGHTVKLGDITHVFHHFGSGTLRGVPTVWSDKCTVSPIHFRHERDVLVLKGVQNIRFLAFDRCPITTVYDIAFDRVFNKQDSVGVGFAHTLKRSELLQLQLSDLKYKTATAIKLNCIFQYYFKKAKELDKVDLFIENVTKLEGDKFSFEEDCEYLLDHCKLIGNSNYTPCGKIIFEGNQGVLLDRYHGFFPYVTYGRTTNYNLQDFIKDQWVSKWYVTRAYLTRHGAGPLPGERMGIKLINSEHETNHLNDYQGEFRVAPLDLHLLNYAMYCDHQDQKNNADVNIVMTCVDQIENSEEVIKSVKRSTHRPLYINTSPESITIKGYEE